MVKIYAYVIIPIILCWALLKFWDFVKLKIGEKIGRKIDRDDYLVKALVGEIWSVSFVGFIFAYSSYSWFFFLNNVRIERGEPRLVFSSFQNKPLLFQFLFSLLLIILGVIIQRKKLWAYKVSLYTLTILSLLSLLLLAYVWVITDTPVPIYVLIFLYLLSLLYRLTRPKVKEQFK